MTDESDFLGDGEGAGGSFGGVPKSDFLGGGDKDEAKGNFEEVSVITLLAPYYHYNYYALYNN